MKSPLTAIIDWLASLPESNRTDAYCSIGGYSPGFEDVKKKIKPGSFDKKLIEEKFLEIVNEAKDSPMSELGMIISLRSVIDFFVCQPKDPNGWKTAKDILNYVGEKNQNPNLKEVAREAQFRAAQTKKVDESWAALRDAELSDGGIRAYKDELSKALLDR